MNAPEPLDPGPLAGGGDAELLNTIVGPGAGLDTARWASRLLLREAGGIPARAREPSVEDHGRVFFRNGGSAYIDLDHYEVCTPEVRSALDFVRYTHASFRSTAEAQARVNEWIRPNRVFVVANNTDGQGNSYGSHVSLCIARPLFQALCVPGPSLEALLGHLASVAPLIGQGKAGSEGSGDGTEYELSQRSEHITRRVGHQTTYARPLMNLRDEPLCGPNGTRHHLALARLHVIVFDQSMMHVPAFLKFGTLQLVLDMLARGRLSAPRFMLRDPVEALHTWSRDPMLEARAPTLAGTWLTAPEMQLQFCEAALRHIESGACSVPGAAQIVDRWDDALSKLRRRAFGELVPLLDWVLKMAVLHRALQEDARLSWHDSLIKRLDLLYASLDPGDGLYWTWERAGAVERLVDEAAIVDAMTAAPSDTRAWTRALLLRLADPADVRDLDWDRVEFCFRTGSRRVLVMPDPIGMTRNHTEPLQASTTGLVELIDELSRRSVGQPSTP